MGRKKIPDRPVRHNECIPIGQHVDKVIDRTPGPAELCMLAEEGEDDHESTSQVWDFLQLLQPKVREAMLRAMSRPQQRDYTQSDLAREIGMSQQALSKQLRRAAMQVWGKPYPVFHTGTPGVAEEGEAE